MQPDTFPTPTANREVKIRLQLYLPLAMLLVLLVIAFLLPDRVWNTLLVGIGGLFGLAYVWVRQLAAGLHGTRRLRFGWVAVGDRLEERFTLHNESLVPAMWVEIVDHSNVPGYRTAVVRSVGPQSSINWREAAICERRGQFHLGPWELKSSDPFGIFSLSIHYPITDSVIIHPPIHGQLPIRLPTGQSSGRARVRDRSWQATNNAATVREHQPMDPKRWIHWPTSARRNKLYVREFDQDAAGDIWLLLDFARAAQVGEGIDGTEEHAVLLAASLSARALQINRAVGLAIYGRQPELVTTGVGQGQRWRILRALALSQADGETPLQVAMHDIGRIARRGTALLVITASAHTDWLPGLITLTQHGIESRVILFDRPSFGGDGNSAVQRDAVRNLGFECHLVHQGEVGEPLHTPQQRGVWNFRVTGLGKVIVAE
jgi:uncharacterized protein (DUF58 family)